MEKKKSKTTFRKWQIVILSIGGFITICLLCIAGSLMVDNIDWITTATAPIVFRIDPTRTIITNSADNQIETTTSLSSFTATYSPNITLVPTFTQIPTLTQFYIPTTIPSPINQIESQKAAKQAGNYLVRIEIAPGLWRNNGNSSNCYWEITSRNGEIIDNDYGYGGGTMYISPDAFAVEMYPECGTWTYLEPP